MTTNEIHERVNHRCGKTIPIKHVAVLRECFEEETGQAVGEEISRLFCGTFGELANFLAKILEIGQNHVYLCTEIQAKMIGICIWFWSERIETGRQSADIFMSVTVMWMAAQGKAANG